MSCFQHTRTFVPSYLTLMVFMVRTTHTWGLHVFLCSCLSALTLPCCVTSDQVLMSYQYRWNTWRESGFLVLAPPLLCILPDIAGTGLVQSSGHHLQSLGDKLLETKRHTFNIVFSFTILQAELTIVKPRLVTVATTVKLPIQLYNRLPLQMQACHF